MAYRILARFDDQTLRFTLKEGRNVLGSDTGCDVCLPNATVSRRHAVINVRGRSILLEDLGSTNGTLLRSQRIDRADLETGDIFVIGRVVVLLEEIPDDDLEVGIGFLRPAGDPSGLITTEIRELTESFSPLDHFTLDHLPRLLTSLAATEVDDQRIAQQVGHALYETMPVTGVEIVEISDGGERGVLFAASGTEDEGNDSEWIECSSHRCQVRARFYKKSAGEHYRPVIEAAMLMLTVAERLRGRVVRTQPPRSTAQRPQPPSVEPDVIRIYEQAERIARGDVGVMIYGESGTGKEVLARFIHSASPRATFTLVAINCASLPRDLLESELFGVEKGVATGVDARPGKFEMADQGTLFLDEIGDMAAETQAKILRVLQEKEVFRIGGHTPRPARCRVIAATNRPIHKMISDGTFRADLYHRIATWEVELPPLRRRRSDIPNLAAFFLTEEAQRLGIRVRGISRAALRALRRYRWPGNVRQLQNEIARSVLFLEDRELLDTGRLSAAIRGQQTAQIGSALSDILEAVERDEILATLEACGSDTTTAAEVLQMSRPTLYRRIKALGIVIPELKE
jgi:DNA-binding NtrC family response regulator/pSer/pThr/pTyr-binding forkhead associated (FHA) protein